MNDHLTTNAILAGLLNAKVSPPAPGFYTAFAVPAMQKLNMANTKYGYLSQSKLRNRSEKTFGVCENGNSKGVNEKLPL